MGTGMLQVKQLIEYTKNMQGGSKK